jgi:hypothetical protein
MAERLKHFEVEMGREVALMQFGMGKELGCWTCGIGKAIDIVGRKYGEPPYDWAGERARDMVSPGGGGPVRHICKNTTWDKEPVEPDRRLPPESDDVPPF